ncbi:YlbF family regulator [Carnobacterium gallinarum]|uniref:YlbF family regulator n=1 Tax=Carnobacterium gallinarum TaxID=2749 RepID=UPI00055870A1|nr:YlbF family regulator [Carnobacterium gallinarum]
MIVTEDYIDMETEALALVQAIMQSEIGENYCLAKIALEQNQVAQNKIHKFNLAKKEFETIEKYGKFAPDYKEKNREVRRLKREMDMDECVYQYRLLETDLQTILDEISLKLARTVSNTIKVPAGNPFFSTGASGCGSGGSCGCG